MAGRVYRSVVQIAYGRAGHDVHLAYSVHLIAEKLDADGLIGRISREYLDRVAADAEHISLESNVISLIAYLDELAQKLVKIARLPRAQGYDHVFIVDRVAETVDARDGCNDYDVAPLKKARRCTVAQALDLVVYCAVLFNEGIRVRNIRLGLIIVVVRDEILHGVIREKLAKLRAQLRRKGLIVRQNERRAVELFDNARHGEGLARAGDAEQNLLIESVFDAAHERLYGLRLIAHRRI